MAHGPIHIAVIEHDVLPKPDADAWLHPAPAMTPLGVRAFLVVDEFGEIVPAAWAASRHLETAA
jgi:hypothetical protein